MFARVSALVLIAALSGAPALAAPSTAQVAAAAKAQAVFIQLGGRPASVPAATAPANHSPYFDVDEAVFETGVKAEVLLALDYLAKK